MEEIWKIAATLGLVVMNAFFVAAEFAAVTARTTRLKAAAKTNLPGRAALLVKDRLDLFLSSCQLGNTLAALALGAVTASAVATLVAPLTMALHMSETAQHALAFLISFAIVVALHIII